MTNREIRELLCERADATRIKEDSNEILQKVRKAPEREEKTAKILSRHRRAWLLPAPAAMLAACLVLALIPTFLTPTGTEDFTLSRAEEVFSIEMLALGNALDKGEGTGLLREVPPATYLSAPGGTGTVTLAASNTDRERIAADVNRYLPTGNALLDKDAVKIDYAKNTDEAFADYAYRLSVTFAEGVELGVSYTAYYNESRALFGRSRITGVFVMGGEQYDMTGEREVDRDEVEMELRVRTGKDTYLCVSNERAASENEYEYVYLENGREVRAVSIEVATEGDVRSTELEISENGVETEYAFTYLDDRILCEYEENEREHEIVIFVYADHYLYTFEDGYTVEIQK